MRTITTWKSKHKYEKNKGNTCYIENCNKPSSCLGLCFNHYHKIMSLEHYHRNSMRKKQINPS